MTVVDSSAVVDYLLGIGAADAVDGLLKDEAGVAAPDVLVFEVLGALRRLALAGEIESPRAQDAVEDLADLTIDLFPSLALCRRAFGLRENLSAADALFAVLAEGLREPLATRDPGMARAVSKHCDVTVLALSER